MISDKVIQTLAKYFAVENRIQTHQDKDYLVTILIFKDREIYRHELDLDPLYNRFRDRMKNDLQ